MKFLISTLMLLSLNSMAAGKCIVRSDEAPFLFRGVGEEVGSVVDGKVKCDSDSNVMGKVRDDIIYDASGNYVGYLEDGMMWAGVRSIVIFRDSDESLFKKVIGKEIGYVREGKVYKYDDQDYTYTYIGNITGDCSREEKGAGAMLLLNM